VLHARIDSQAVTIFVGTELGQQPLARVDSNPPAVRIFAFIVSQCDNVVCENLTLFHARVRVRSSKFGMFFGICGP
jgi:hypothetical protein